MIILPRGQLTNNLRDGALCPALEFLQFLLYAALQIPVRLSRCEVEEVLQEKQIKKANTWRQ